MIQIITATGTRPEGFALCEKYMARQTHTGAVRWLIVDDGATPTPVTLRRPGWEIESYRPTPHWAPGMNTQHRNLGVALSWVDDRFPVVVVEDDDWYGPGYLAAVVAALQDHEMVGQRSSWKYSLMTRRARVWTDPGKSSLCSTAVRGQALRRLREIVHDRARLIDMVLWATVPGHLFDGRHVVGIKGLPGRGGIDSGHSRRFGDIADPAGALLSEWIGADAAPLMALTPAPVRRPGRPLTPRQKRKALR